MTKYQSEPLIIEQEREERNRLSRLTYEELKLQARVRHLKMEEEKIIRTITETKTRAERIFDAKKRNEEKLIDRLRTKDAKDQQ